MTIHNILQDPKGEEGSIQLSSYLKTIIDMNRIQALVSKVPSEKVIFLFRLKTCLLDFLQE